MGKEGTGGLFSQGGGGKPFWGVGGGAAGCKIAPQACTCHANPPGTIVPVPTRGLAAPGGLGQDAGAVLPEGVCLVPKGTPKSGPRKAAPAPSLLTPLFGFLAPVPFGEGTCFDLPIFPPRSPVAAGPGEPSAPARNLWGRSADGPRPEVSRQHRP